MSWRIKNFILRRDEQAGDLLTPLLRALAVVRWLVPVLIFMASSLHEMILAWLLPRTDPRFHAWMPVIVYGVTGSVAVWWGVGVLIRTMEERERAVEELRSAYENLAETHRRLLAVYDIGREIASAADMGRVLEIAARAPVSLLNARGAGVFTFDEDRNRLHLEMVWGLSDEYVRQMRERVDLGLVADRCRSCEVLRANVSGDCPLFEGMKEIARREGIHSLACLPFGSGGRRDGILTAYFASPSPPSESEMYLLSVVAAEIASVLESLRLRDRQMTSMFALEQLVDVAEDETQLWQEMLDITLRAWNVQRGAILVPDESHTTFRWFPHGLEGMSAATRERLSGLAARVLETRTPYVVPDTGTSGEFRALRDFAAGIAAIPLITGSDVLAIMILLADTPGHFRGHHVPFFLSIGYHAGLALSNTRLRAQIEHLAVLEERYRISREIHDGLAQSLSFIGWRIDRAGSMLRKKDWERLERELSEIRAALRDAYQDVREAIDGLRMPVEHPGGLAGSLAEYARDFEERTGIRVKVESSLEPEEIPPEISMHLLRVAQEALTNVRKHAQASQVSIRLIRKHNEVELDIEDDGRGFNPDAPRSRSHVGLLSMRERVHKLGGTFTLLSRPGAGTRISVVVPLVGSKAGVLERVEGAGLP